MAIHWDYSCKKFASINPLNVIWYAISVFPVLASELVTLWCKVKMSSKLEKRKQVSDKLLEEIDFARRNPQYVLLDKYHICLGHNTYWIENFPYAFGAKTVKGYWKPRYYFMFLEKEPGYISGHYCRVLEEDGVPVKVHFSAQPTLYAKYQLAKFIKEFANDTNGKTVY